MINLTREEILAKLNTCGQKLNIIQAALADCDFKFLAAVMEKVNTDLEEIFYALEEDNQHE